MRESAWDLTWWRSKEDLSETCQEWRMGRENSTPGQGVTVEEWAGCAVFLQRSTGPDRVCSEATVKILCFKLKQSNTIRRFSRGNVSEVPGELWLTHCTQFRCHLLCKAIYKRAMLERLSCICAHGPLHTPPGHRIMCWHISVTLPGPCTSLSDSCCFHSYWANSISVLSSSFMSAAAFTSWYHFCISIKTDPLRPAHSV